MKRGIEKRVGTCAAFTYLLMSGRSHAVKVSRGKLQPHYAVVVDIFMQIHLVVCRAIRSTNRAPMHRVGRSRRKSRCVRFIGSIF